MAITSIGYPGTIAPGEDWANLQRALGKHLAVDEPHAFRVTASSTGTRQVKVAGPGRAMGEGILDELDATVEMPSLPSVPSGSKYFLIVLNRHWDDDSGGFRSELGYIEGTAARAIPAYVKTPGVLSQQPLALVRITAGNTVPTEIVDLRVVSTDGAGGNIVYDDLALASGLGGNAGAIVRNATTGQTYIVGSDHTYGRTVEPLTERRETVAMIAAAKARPPEFIELPSGDPYLKMWLMFTGPMVTLTINRSGAPDGGISGGGGAGWVDAGPATIPANGLSYLPPTNVIPWEFRPPVEVLGTLITRTGSWAMGGLIVDQFGTAIGFNPTGTRVRDYLGHASWITGNRGW